MYTYYIVKAGESAPEERINKAIENFGYKGQDVICVARGGYTSEVETAHSVRNILNDFETTDIDELAKKYIEQKEKQESE